MFIVVALILHMNWFSYINEVHEQSSRLGLCLAWQYTKLLIIFIYTVPHQHSIYILLSAVEHIYSYNLLLINSLLLGLCMGELGIINVGETLSIYNSHFISQLWLVETNRRNSSARV